MSALGGLVFASPWMLAALAVLPLIWWLLKVTPPAPKRVPFPPVRLLFGLHPREETPATTPPWLIALRLALAALLIFALAHPILNLGARLAGDGPVIVAVDDGWAAARHWERRAAAMDALLAAAERDDRPVIILPTAPAADTGAVRSSGLLHAEEARRLVQAMAPKPWAVDRAAAAAVLDRLGFGGGVDVVWLSSGVDDGSAEAFGARAAALGRLQVITDPDLDRPRALLPPESGPGALRLTLLRAADAGEERLWVRATGEEGAVLARAQATFGAGELSTEVAFDAPAEQRNRIVRIDIENERGAGAVVLLDERWRRRPVGLISGGAIETQQPLLSELYYLERALNPFSEVRTGELRELLRRPLAALVLADVAKVVGDDRAVLEDWLEDGGVLIRFAGPRLAEGVDDLVPVRLRGGGRVLGGALSWSEPARLTRFDADTPFAGLTIPDDVRVRRQVLAEPALDLAGKTWARLADGTPLVTAERRGRGWLVLMHTTASTAWSDLAISGLFVEMLQRLVGLSQGIVGDDEERLLVPLKTLDGFGRLADPPPESRPIAAGAFAEATAGPGQPPGFYGAGSARRALNLTAGLDALEPIGALPTGAQHRVFGEGGVTDLKPWLLAAALLLGLIDLVVGLALRGLLPLGARGAAALALSLVAAAPAAAQDADDFVLAATLESRLAYIRTGNDTVDRISRAGLVGLGAVLRARTSIEPADPIAIDVERDELIFFPLVYWPITADQPPLSGQAAARVTHYLKTGGIILFDTRDQNAGPSQVIGGRGPGARRLRTLLGDLDIPPLTPVPPEHVLTRAFYLIQDFPGRWAGGRVWVERYEGGVNDGVSSLIIGSHDWAAAWAVDERRNPMFAVVPGGERQREMAYRFGINLTMYAMTGNYKADQVHLPAILERLGQ
ncbi:MAG: DUF4159 domain-containing protein [Proteobacteria bacterium]|nr:DUF4159 domain-containing protein [Pseudomonadota bacterium]